MNHENHHENTSKHMHHAKKYVTKIENFLSPLFEKAPHLPREIKNLLILVNPWLAIILGIIGVVGSLGGGTVSALLAIPTLGLSLPFLLSFLFVFAASIFAIMAFSGLKENKKSGWDKLFLSQILFVLSSVVLITFGGVTLVTILVTLISFYLMFEIRNHYK
jgi:hypothetical protein